MRRLLLLIIALLVLAAPAAAAADPWAPDNANIEVFSPERKIFNDQGLEDQTSFTCLTEQGRQLSATESEQLSKILLAASDVYNGDFTFATVSNLDPSQKPPSNGGYPVGQPGMRDFLLKEQQLLRSGKWVDYTMRSLQRQGEESSYPSPSPGWNISLQADSGAISAGQGAVLAEMINPDAESPLRLTEDLPPACAISPADPSSPQFGELFSNSGDFFTNMILYPPAKLAAAGYDFIQPYAFKYTFYTPHTELGDLFWNSADSCTPGAECRNGRPLGIDSSVTASDSSRPWFLSAAQFVQWLVSGAFFLVLFASAALFILRGNRSTSLRLMELLPRMVLSVLMAVFAGALIGALISFSNLLVATIFEFTGDQAIANINVFMLQAGNIVGGPQLFQNLVALLVGAMTTFFFLIFVLFTLARQLVLVAGIILAPLAAFSLIVPRWKPSLRIYLRAMLTAVFMPVILSFILVVGMEINPLVNNPEGSYGQLQGALGLMLMLVTLWLMYRSIKMSKEYILKGELIPAPGRDGRSVRQIIGDQLSAAKDQAKLIPAGRSAGASTVSSDSKALPQSTGFSRANAGSSPQGIRPGNASGGGRRISKGQANSYRRGMREAIGAKQANLNRPLKPEELQQLKAAYAAKNGGQIMEQNGSWYLVPAEPTGYQGVSD